MRRQLSVSDCVQQLRRRLEILPSSDLSVTEVDEAELEVWDFRHALSQRREQAPEDLRDIPEAIECLEKVVNHLHEMHKKHELVLPPYRLENFSHHIDALRSILRRSPVPT